MLDVRRVSASVFGAVARRAHFHELRIELAEDFDQVGLRGHDGVDVLIDKGANPEPLRSRTLTPIKKRIGKRE